jgi:hypothetical protein
VNEKANTFNEDSFAKFLAGEGGFQNEVKTMNLEDAMLVMVSLRTRLYDDLVDVAMKKSIKQV